MPPATSRPASESYALPIDISSAPEVGEAEAERAEVMRVLGDALGRISGVVDQDFLRDDQRVDGVAETFDVERAVALPKLHQVQRRQVAGRVVKEHVFRAGVRRVDAVGVLRRVPLVDGGVELHARVAALVGGFRDVLEQLAGLLAVLLPLGEYRARPPLFVLRGGLHELVGGADGVVGVLKGDGLVGVAVEGAVKAGFDEGPSLALLLGLAPDEVLDVGMVGVEDDHLGGAAGFAAGLDDAGEGVKTLHEGDGAGGAAAAGEGSVVLADLGEVGAGAGAPLEEHALGLGEVHNGLERIADRVDEASRALGILLLRAKLGNGPGFFVPGPAVAARLADADVEPDRRVEARHLVEHQVRELHAEVLGVGGGVEVVILLAPFGDGVDDAVDEVADGRLSVLGPDGAVEILGGDDIGGGLRPVARHGDVGLLKDGFALGVGDRGGAFLPLQDVVGGLSGLEVGGEVS